MYHVTFRGSCMVYLAMICLICFVLCFVCILETVFLRDDEGSMP
jgi:hypothetical protein